LIRKRVI